MKFCRAGATRTVSYDCNRCLIRCLWINTCIFTPQNTSVLMWNWLKPKIIVLHSLSANFQFLLSQICMLLQCARCTCFHHMIIIINVRKVEYDLFLFTGIIYTSDPRTVWFGKHTHKTYLSVLLTPFGCMLFVFAQTILTHQTLGFRPLSSYIFLITDHLFSNMTRGREDVTQQILPSDWRKTTCHSPCSYCSLALPAYKKHPLPWKDDK